MVTLEDIKEELISYGPLLKVLLYDGSIYYITNTYGTDRVYAKIRKCEDAKEYPVYLTEIKEILND